MTEHDAKWFTGAHYTEYPSNFITFSGLSRKTRNYLLGALRVPRVPDARVKALEVGPGYHPLLTDKGFGHSTFLDFSGWFTRHLKQGLNRVAPARAHEYLMKVRKRDWSLQPHLGSIYREKGEWAKIKKNAQDELDAIVDADGLKEPERFSFVKGDLRSLPFRNGAFHLGFLPEVLTHIEPEQRADAVGRLADAITHRLVIVDRPPQPGLLLEAEPIKFIKPAPPKVEPVMSKQAVDPEELRKVLIGKGFRVRVERHTFSHLPNHEDVEDYFVLIADRQARAPVRRGNRTHSASRAGIASARRR